MKLSAVLVAATVVHVRATLEDELQQIIDAQSELYNISFSLGVYSDQMSLALHAGPGSSPDALYPAGSVTKSFTAAAIMKLQDAGVLNITDPISQHADPILSRLNQTSVQQLFGGDPRAASASIADFLNMVSGAPDYDDDQMQNWTVSNPDLDFTPLDYFHKWWGEKLKCDPGLPECGQYSTTGYMLLGMVLAQHANVQSWEEYDQHQVLPVSEFNLTKFPLRGKCSSDAQIVRPQWGPQSDGSEGGDTRIVDWDKFSCLNGWTGGNIASTANNIAKFYYMLLGPEPRIVSRTSVRRMTQWVPLGGSWASGLAYGLGLFKFQGQMMEMMVGLQGKNAESVDLIGHGGQDWGSTAVISGYSPKLRVGVSLTMNGLQGMNSSFDPGTSVTESNHAYPKTFCRVYEKLQRTLGDPEPLNCTEQYRTPAAPCVCRTGSKYDGKRPINWVRGRTCDDLLGLIRTEVVRAKKCVEIFPWLIEHHVLDATRNACCVPNHSDHLLEVHREATTYAMHIRIPELRHRFRKFRL